MHHLKRLFAPALTLILGAMLLATIYFTLFDLQWIAFLAGVLFAAVAATSSQNVNAQWRLARRTRQLERTRETLTSTIRERENSAAALSAAQTGFRLINEALPVMIAFVDSEERCGYHNQAFASWCGRGIEKLDGLPLGTVLSGEAHLDIKRRSAALTTRKLNFATTWPCRDGGREDVDVTLLRYPPDAETATGYYVLISRKPAAEAAPAARHEDAGSKSDIVSQDSGGTVYLESMTDQLIGGDDPRERLVKALREDQFILFAQKIEAIRGGPPNGRCMEVLLRMQEEEDLMLPPGGFFPVAERYGLLAEIDRWVVRNLLRLCAAHQRAAPDWSPPLFCLNLSSATLNDPGFPRFVQTELEDNKQFGHCLCFEISELDLISHHRDIRALIAILAPHGCRFTIDGFGGSKVSFAPFKELKFDFVKIDGNIILNILTEKSEFAKTKAIVLACRRIGVGTIAAFVETDETVIKLREIGVDFVQGFGIGRPERLDKLL
ncbi:MAG: diguanylate phosphodiesterase [Betaproteobacteria bacterium]|nr:diguanylate phosphodiesterase [Betaproteobacteria bacterium]